MLLAVAAFLIAGPSAAAQVASGAPQFRRLAPGVLTTIPAEVLPEETVSHSTLPALRSDPDLDWTPKSSSKSRTLFERAGAVEFRRDVWCLELSFKPLRMITVDVPQPSGRLQQKLVWYMVYRVTNTGVSLHPEQTAGGTFEAKPGPAAPHRFIPQFVLESRERDAKGKPANKAYLSRIIPAAVVPIQEREDRNRRLLSTAEMASVEIPLSKGRINRSIWGVVTWEDVDPELDFFSVYVGGLTNAYRWTNPKGAYRQGDPPGAGRQFAWKTLQLNFWRPGDELREHEEEIRFGVPPGMSDLYDCDEGVAYRWTYP
jgi:hypothetical protein